MAIRSYTDPNGFVFSYDESETNPKDRIRALIGDTNGIPMWLVSDMSLEATINDPYLAGNFWEQAAQCAEKAGAAILSLQQEIRQGHRLDIKNFDPVKMRAEFMAMAKSFRNNQLAEATTPNYGALSKPARFRGMRDYEKLI